MKTPMQELIEQLKEQVQFIIDKEELKALYGCNDHTEDRMWRSGMREAIKIAESKLEKEEKLIMKIYNHAVLHGMLVEMGNTDIINAEEYYNKTFKTKEG